MGGPPPPGGTELLKGVFSRSKFFSLAPTAAINLDQKFSSAPLAPLKTQHHGGGGGHTPPPPHPLDIRYQGLVPTPPP